MLQAHVQPKPSRSAALPWPHGRTPHGQCFLGHLPRWQAVGAQPLPAAPARDEAGAVSAEAGAASAGAARGLWIWLLGLCSRQEWKQRPLGKSTV